MADPPELPGGWLPPQAPQPQRPAYQPPQQPEPPVFVKRDGQERQPTNRLAVSATVCASISIALLVFSIGGSFFFSLPLAVAGWVCAARADADVNPRQIRTGKLLSIIAVVLSVVAMTVWIVLMLLGYFPEDLQRDLERELERSRRSS